ncbi:hypothetical protein CTAYLR_004107 [Chrysophaeum taylorii]|uniref:cGMP-dependent protein kinase n=1 Tax=Chrysophaeum taylorii TaxID=2483200 RepID=A0AAD7UEB0_9STRA|nr:hypothetical protein CTAYLR_004107 [Chrysophaeum taylorii]
MGCRHSKQAEVEAPTPPPRRVRKNVWEAVDWTTTPETTTPPYCKETREALGAALRRNELLASLLSDDDDDGGGGLCDRIVDRLQRQEVARGTELITIGTTGDLFYAVEQGYFDVAIGEKVVKSCGPGDSFGELAVVYGAPRAASVVATTDAVVWAIDRATFRSATARVRAKTKERVLDSLGKVELLEGLTEEQLDAVADAVRCLRYPAGTRIITKNETGNAFYMILEGKVVCTDIGQSLQFQDLELGSGEYFGERALLTDQLRFANVTAQTDVTLLALDREAFQRCLGNLRSLLDHNLSMRVLNSLEIFGKLSETERKKTASLFAERSYKSNETIVRQGDRGDEFFILKTGTARVEKSSSSSSAGGTTTTTTTIVDVLEAGDYFGEKALIREDERRAASVVSQTDCDCFVLSRTHFQSQEIDRVVVARDDDDDDGGGGGLRRRRRRVPFDELEHELWLGAGTYGRVSLVSNNNRETLYALKTMYKAEIVRANQVRNVLAEKETMVLCRHAFVVDLVETYQDRDHLYLLLEFVEGGELFSVIHGQKRDGVPEMSARFYAAVVCLALDFIHDKHVAYRDLKPENILVDAAGYPKIADFGFAKRVTRATYTLCGTPEYLAPEIILGRGHNKSVDWWAFGVLVYEMLAGFSPFAPPAQQEDDVDQVCRNIVSKRASFPQKIFPPTVQDLCTRLLDRSPVSRLGTNPQNPVARHPWFSTLLDDHDNNGGKGLLEARRVQAPWLPQIKSDTSNHAGVYDNKKDAIDPYYKDDPSLWAGF